MFTAQRLRRLSDVPNMATVRKQKIHRKFMRLANIVVRILSYSIHPEFGIAKNMF